MNLRDGERTDGQLGQPAPLPGAESQLPDTAETLMARGLEEGFAAFRPEPDDVPLDDFGQPPAEPSDDEELIDDTAAEADGEDEEPDESAASDATDDATPKKTRSASEWAEVIARDGVQRLAEVPRALYTDVVAAYGDLKASTGAQSAQSSIAESIRRQDELTSWVAQIDTHFDGDPDGKLEWMSSTDPQTMREVDLYRSGNRLLTRLSTQTPEERVGDLAALNERAQRQYARLAGLGEAQAELVRRREGGRYAGDPVAALDVLERDVDELMRTGYARSGTETPVEAAADGGQVTRKRPARPIVGSGATAGGVRRARTNVPDISKITDPTELIGMGLSQGLTSLR